MANPVISLRETDHGPEYWTLRYELEGMNKTETYTVYKVEGAEGEFGDVYDDSFKLCKVKGELDRTDLHTLTYDALPKPPLERMAYYAIAVAFINMIAVAKKYGPTAIYVEYYKREVCVVPYVEGRDKPTPRKQNEKWKEIAKNGGPKEEFIEHFIPQFPPPCADGPYGELSSSPGLKTRAKKKTKPASLKKKK